MASIRRIDGVFSDMRIEKKGTSFHELDFRLIFILCHKIKLTRSATLVKTSPLFFIRMSENTPSIRHFDAILASSPGSFDLKPTFAGTKIRKSRRSKLPGGNLPHKDIDFKGADRVLPSQRKIVSAETGTRAHSKAERRSMTRPKLHHTGRERKEWPQF